MYDRFLLGIGVGAEYPCGSVAASEQSEEKGVSKNAQHRWFALATSTYRSISLPLIFLNSRFRRLHDRLWLCSLIICATRPLLDVRVYADPICCHADPVSSFGNNHLRAVWRLSLGLGVVPAVAVFLWRLQMEEPTRFKKDSMKNAKIPYKLILARYWKGLLAVSLTWCVSVCVLALCNHVMPSVVV